MMIIVLDHQGCGEAGDTSASWGVAFFGDTTPCSQCRSTDVPFICVCYRPGQVGSSHRLLSEKNVGFSEDHSHHLHCSLLSFQLCVSGVMQILLNTLEVWDLSHLFFKIEGYLFLYFLKCTFKWDLTGRKINRSDSHDLKCQRNDSPQKKIIEVSLWQYQAVL